MSDLLTSPPSSAPTHEQPGRQRWWTRLLLYLIIFVSGTVVGAGGAVMIVRQGVIRAVHHPEDMPRLIAQRMRGVLSLSTEQAEQVEQILRRRQSALQDIRRQYQPQVEAELDEIDRQISAVLTAEQRPSWQQRFRQLRSTWMPALPREQIPLER